MRGEPELSHLGDTGFGIWNFLCGVLAPGMVLVILYMKLFG